MGDIYIDRYQDAWDNRFDELDEQAETQLQQHDFANEEFWQRVNESSDKLNF